MVCDQPADGSLGGAQEHSRDGLKHKVSGEPGAMEMGSLEEEETTSKVA